MRKESYLKFDENSEHEDPDNLDNDANSTVSKQFTPFRRRNSKVTNEASVFSDKLKDLKDFYQEALPGKNQAKPLTQKSPQKINSAQVNKALRTGRDKKNTSRKNFNNKALIQDFLVEQTEVTHNRGQITQQSKASRSEYRSQHYIHSNESSPLKKAQTPTSDLKMKRGLRSLKDAQRRGNKFQEGSEWREIESMLENKQQQKQEDEPPIIQRSYYQKGSQLEAAKSLLTGKVSIIWIFVISTQLEESDEKRIIKMYQGLSETSSFLVPLCRNAKQMNSFLQIPNSLFKIVADLQNFKEVLRCSSNSKVVEFYVYNNKGEKGIPKALSFKAETRKVKGIFSSLKKIINRAEQQIENQIQIFQNKKGIALKNKVKKFPSFMKLSGEDKTYATLYRSNLYGAKNLQKSELSERLNDFLELVKQKYANIPVEQQNIKDYENMNHFAKDFTNKQAKEVIKFYVRESFYYQVLNSMLRTMKTTQEFKPCILPFHETYQSIKRLYLMDLKQNGMKIQKKTLYRGAKLRERDFNILKPGVFIEMFGFMSTSKSYQKAIQFCDRDGFIFIINIPNLTISEDLNKYDHGFIDINKHELADKTFQAEEEILFNCLNVFQVTKIEKDGGRHIIYLQYGSIFSLVGKQKSSMTSDEKDVLLNYQYCAQMLNEIEDQGDVHLIANEYEQSKQYYEAKLQENGKESKYFYKLANVQQQCGQLDNATKNVKISLQMQQENMDLNEREKFLKVFSIHSKNAQISLTQEDYLTADESITQAIHLLGSEQGFEKGRKLRERGEIKFKKGEIIEAQKDFQLSQNIFKSLANKAVERKKEINRQYLFSFLTLICIKSSQQDLEREREQNMKQVQSYEKQLRNMEGAITEELIKVNNSLKDVALYVQDKQKYEICVKKARAYLLGVQSKITNDPFEKARLKALQATVQDYLQLAESQRLLHEAIWLIESNQPFHENVGKYSQMLGNLQKKQLQKYSNPKYLPRLVLHKGMKPIKYDEQEHRRVYEKCKKNFEKAINVMKYNNKTKNNPEFLSLKNALGELQFYQSKFDDSQKIIQQSKLTPFDGGHSELARSSLLLSKISFARGEQKNSFEQAQESLILLRVAIVKKEEPEYHAAFQINDLLLEIKMQKSRIYIKQLNNDMSLRQLHDINNAIFKKLHNLDSHYLLADIYELKAENMISQNDDFQSQFELAIKLRERQVGQCNLPNAITFCNYAKYLILVREFAEAERMLQKALQIFSCFSQDHPITWLVLYCLGLLKQKKQLYDDSVVYIVKSLERVQKKFDKGHITIHKIRLQYAKALHNVQKYDEAIKQFESLEGDLEDEITASQIRNVIEEEKDDEKITVKKFLYESLRQSYFQKNNADKTNLNMTGMGLDRCEVKISDLRRTYKMDGPKQQY